MKKYLHILLLFPFLAIVCIQGAEQYQLSRAATPHKYKAFFDEAVAAGNVNKVIAMLTSETAPVEIQNLKYSYSLAKKLYRILMDESDGEDFTQDAVYVPIDKIFYVAKELAREGGNQRFLRNIPT